MQHLRASFFVLLSGLSTLSLAADNAMSTQSIAMTEAATVKYLAGQFIANPDPADILFWNTEQRRYGFKNLNRIYPTRPIMAGPSPYPIGERPMDLSGLSYSVGGKKFAIADFLEHSASMGLLVVKDGDAVFEYYASGNDASSRWVTFSVTKSVTSMLIGAAIQDGYIESVDESVVDYLPRLRGSAYEGASIADILHMASGVAWDENYADANSDVAKAGGLNGIDLIRYLSALPRESEPGAVFNYNTGETNLVGEVLRSAIGNNASSYLSAKIWKPFGMEHDASWAIAALDGAELGGCCISATLRDYVRIGLFALNDGQLPDGTRVVPEGWMQASTTASEGSAGYGYLWWLYGDEAYAARGIFGQQIRIVPDKSLVIAVHSNAPGASGTDYHEHIDAVLAAISDSFDE